MQLNFDGMQFALHLFNFLIIALMFIGIPLLIIYAIYRAIRTLIDHEAELRNHYNNNNQNREER